MRTKVLWTKNANACTFVKKERDKHPHSSARIHSDRRAKERLLEQENDGEANTDENGIVLEDLKSVAADDGCMSSYYGWLR